MRHGLRPLRAAAAPLGCCSLGPAPTPLLSPSADAGRGRGQRQLFQGTRAAPSSELPAGSCLGLSGIRGGSPSPKRLRQLGKRVGARSAQGGGAPLSFGPRSGSTYFMESKVVAPSLLSPLAVDPSKRLGMGNKPPRRVWPLEGLARSDCLTWALDLGPSYTCRGLSGKQGGKGATRPGRDRGPLAWTGQMCHVK